MQDQDQDQDFNLCPRDQDHGLEDYNTGKNTITAILTIGHRFQSTVHTNGPNQFTAPSLPAWWSPI